MAAILGSGAMTNSIQEIEGMDVILTIGTNTKESHPVIANRMIKAIRKGAKLILADPRMVPMRKFADIHLQLRPGTDIALLNGLAHVILKEGLQDESFIKERTTGFKEWTKSVEEYTPEYVEKITSVPKEDLIRAARLYGGSRKAGLFYTMGITQHTHGTANVSAVANLVLLTGNIGRESTGVNPLRGQNNVQGACDVGALPNTYPGYQKVDLPAVKEKFENAWGVPLSGKAGLTTTEMLEEAKKGNMKAIYIMGENPVSTDPNQSHTVSALKALDFLVVQDIFMTETAQLADVVLPSTCFAEKEGTFSNTERKVQLLRKAVDAPGEARDDSDIIIELSNRMGYPMDYGKTEDILEEIGSVWQAMAGISFRRLEKGGIHWPCPSRDHPGTPILHKGSFPIGKAPFTSLKWAPPAEVPDAEYPYVLTTGRNLFQYHSGSMTRRVKDIEAHAGTPYVELNPDDAETLKVENGGRVRVASRRGEIALGTRVTAKVPKGIVFIPMHYSEALANVLTNDACDPTAKTPEFKACAVKLERC